MEAYAGPRSKLRLALNLDPRFSLVPIWKGGGAIISQRSFSLLFFLSSYRWTDEASSTQ
jgi:hypothetical protein